MLFSEAPTAADLANFIIKQSKGNHEKAIIDISNSLQMPEYSKEQFDVYLLDILREVSRQQAATANVEFMLLLDSSTAGIFVSRLRKMHNKILLDGNMLTSSFVQIQHFFQKTKTLNTLSAAIKFHTEVQAEMQPSSRQGKRGCSLGRDKLLLESVEYFYEAPLGGGPYTFTTVQMLYTAGTILFAALFGAFLLIGYLLLNQSYLASLSASTRLVSLLLVFILLQPILLLAALLPCTAAVRWTSSSISPGVFPLWGSTHLKVWLISRYLGAIIALGKSRRYMFSSLFRMLGAKHIGDDIHWCGPASTSEFRVLPHLFSCGDEVTLDEGVVVTNWEFHNNCIIVGPIHLERNTHVGCRCYVGPFTHLQQRSELEPMASSQFIRTGPDEVWAGVPAQYKEKKHPLPPGLVARRKAATKQFGWSSCLYFTLMFTSEFIFGLATAVVTIALILCFAVHPTNASPLQVEGDSFLAYATSLYLWCFSATVAGRLAPIIIGPLYAYLLPSIEPGLYPRYSKMSMVCDIKEGLITMGPGAWMGSCMFAYFLKLYGVIMEDGCSNSEISTLHGMLPDITCVGNNSFWGMGAFITQTRHSGGYLTVLGTRLPTQCFLGNKAVLAPGDYPSHCMLGVGSYFPPHVLRKHLNSCRDEDSTWFGIPPFKMPQRKTQSSRPSDCVVPGQSPFIPSLYQYIQRFVMRDFVEWICVSIPPWICIVVFFFIATQITIMSTTDEIFYPSWSVFAVATGCMAVSAVAVPTVLLMLGLLMRRGFLCGGNQVPKKEHRMWDYDTRVVEVFWWCTDPFTGWWLQLTQDTLMANSIVWRPLGATVGARTLLIGYESVDICSTHVGKDSCISYPKYQLHSYEERVLKIGNTEIGDRVTLVNCCLMAGTKVGSDVTIIANSSVLKGDELPSNKVYSGVPTNPDEESTDEKANFAGKHQLEDFSHGAEPCMAGIAGRSC